ALPGDYLSGVADRVGVRLEKLLLDNRDTLRDPDSPLAGKRLAVCPLGVSPPAQAVAPAPGPALDPAPAPAPVAVTILLAEPSPLESRATQLRSLLGLRAAVDRQGTLAWSAEKGADAGYCSFYGITCDTQGDVSKIVLAQAKLGGTLPPASVLNGLSALTGIDLGATSISGTLPSDWGALAQLEDIRIGGNPGITGSLLPSWAGLTRLKVLYLK
ncbi:hypothetical protein MNEG_11713, partial [Monoraphidium neglectum]